MATVDGPGTDRELLRRCREGDGDAWEALVRKYRRLVYSIPNSSGLRPEEVDEVFQSVFQALLRHVAELRQDETLVPWLVTTAKREAWRVSRRLSRENRLRDDLDHLDLPEPAPLPLDDLEAIERQLAVRAALDAMDTRCRRLLELLFYGEPPPSYAEVSRSMKMPIPSIGPTRLRCLEKLRRALAGKGVF